jgi:hypothetical protein
MYEINEYHLKVDGTGFPSAAQQRLKFWPAIRTLSCGCILITGGTATRMCKNIALQIIKYEHEKK